VDVQLIPGGNMLVLTRKKDQTLVIGDNIEITVLDIQGDQIRFGINAPKNVKIYRKEIYLEIQQENKNAARNAFAKPVSLKELINIDGGRISKRDGSVAAPAAAANTAAAPNTATAPVTSPAPMATSDTTTVAAPTPASNAAPAPAPTPELNAAPTAKPNAAPTPVAEAVAAPVTKPENTAAAAADTTAAAASASASPIAID